MRFEEGIKVWHLHTEALLQIGDRYLSRKNLRSMLKISCASRLCLSPVILV